jgi:uncharacterized Zn finger protein (UPF0148 family)
MNLWYLSDPEFDPMRSDIIDFLPHYQCPHCKTQLLFETNELVECPECEKSFYVEYVPSEFSDTGKEYIEIKYRVDPKYENKE